MNEDTVGEHIEISENFLTSEQGVLVMFRELIRTLAYPAGQDPTGCTPPFECQGYHISLHHGGSGVRIAVVAQNLQKLLQLSVRNEEGVEAHQTVTDNTAIVELEGVVVFIGVKPDPDLDSGCVVILLSQQEKFTVVEVLVPRDALYHVCNDLQPGDSLPTILPVKVARRLAETFITRDAVQRQAVRMGIPLVPDNMMLVPKTPVEPRPAEDLKDRPVKITVKKPARRPPKVRHQMAPKKTGKKAAIKKPRSAAKKPRK